MEYRRSEKHEINVSPFYQYLEMCIKTSGSFKIHDRTTCSLVYLKQSNGGAIKMGS